MRFMPLLIIILLHMTQGWWVQYIVAPSMDNELLLANAAREKGGAFVVHRAVE